MLCFQHVSSFFFSRIWLTHLVNDTLKLSKETNQFRSFPWWIVFLCFLWYVSFFFFFADWSSFSYIFNFIVRRTTESLASPLVPHSNPKGHWFIFRMETHAFVFVYIPHWLRCVWDRLINRQRRRSSSPLPRGWQADESNAQNCNTLGRVIVNGMLTFDLLRCPKG